MRIRRGENSVAGIDVQVKGASFFNIALPGFSIDVHSRGLDRLPLASFVVGDEGPHVVFEVRDLELVACLLH